MWDNFFLSRAIGLPFGGIQAIVPSVLWRVGRLLNASGELLTRLLFAVSVEKISENVCVLARCAPVKIPCDIVTVEG